MATPTSIWYLSPTLPEPATFMRWPSRVQELGGNPCRETGGKIGKATCISMAKPSLSKSPPATAATSSPTTLLLRTGLLVKPSPAASSVEEYWMTLAKLQFTPKDDCTILVGYDMIITSVNLLY